MKPIIILSAFFLLTLGTFAQFRANLSEGASNSIVFSVRPESDVTNYGFSTMEFFVRYPKSSPAFTYGSLANNLTNFPGMGTWSVFKNHLSDATHNYDYFVYTAPQPITTPRNYTLNTVYELFSVPVNGAQVKDLGLTLVHQEDESQYYYAFTNQIGVDARPASLSNYFYPATSVSGVAPTRIYAQDIVLPVNFLSFFAIKNGEDAKLTWQVDGDKDNSHFQVLRSTDGRNFKPVQKVEALRNGQNLNGYEAMDYAINKLGAREVFYQIQQFDKDGQTVKSAVRMLSVDGLGKAVTAFPNPAKTTTKVVVDAPEEGQGSLIMRDAAGRQMRVINARFYKGINQFEMNVMGLSAGDYNIQVTGAGINEVIKVTKVN